uniref:Putative secreted protein n=1 Tax=Amblyomma cajennense TaxID=34607 RepID=A0A023FFG3_AMBCJ
MLTAVLICVNLALLITAQMDAEPPNNSDPDCNIISSQDHVYENCTFVCEGDQVSALNERQRCKLDGTEGECVEGECKPSLKEREDMPQIEIAKQSTGDSKPPGCNDNVTTPHVHKHCAIKCGDSLEVLNNGEPCLLPEPSGVPSVRTYKAVERSETGTGQGVCKEGQCVRKQDYPMTP